MIAMPKLPPQDQALEVAQRRAHRLEALPKLDERPLKKLFRKAYFHQPRPQVRIVPSIESDLRHMIVLEYILQSLGDELVRDRCAGRRFEIALLGPQVIGRPVAGRLFRQPLLRQPEDWPHVPPPVSHWARSSRRLSGNASIMSIASRRRTS